MSKPSSQQAGTEPQTPSQPSDPARLNLLLEMLLRLAGSDGREDVLTDFATQFSWVVSFEQCWIMLTEQDGAVSYHCAPDCDPSESVAEISAADEQIMVRTVRDQAVQRLEEHETGQVVLCVPLRVGEQTTGAVLLRSQRRDAFDRHDVRYTQAAATALAGALDRVRRVEALTRSRDELQFAYVGAHDSSQIECESATIVREPGNQLPGIESFDNALELWATQARVVIGAHQGAVSYIPRGNFTEGKHAVSLSDKYAKYRTYDVLPTGEGIWHLVATKKLSFYMTDGELKSHTAWKNFSDMRDERGLEHPPMRGWLAVPILNLGQDFVGLIQLSDKYDGEFTADDLQRLRRLGQLMAPAFALQYSNEETQRQNQVLTETKDALERSNDDLQKFAYVASHDLQEPLRAVAGYCQLLDQRYSEQLDDDAREFIGFAVEGAERMQALIHGLLDYSRIESQGRIPKEVDAGEAVQQSLANMRGSIVDSGATIQCDALPTVVADGAQLSRLFQNLISNALKYRSEATPQIDITCQDNGDDWQFSVRDNGIGIDSKYADRIFVIFQRLHTRKEYPGTGIGLAICKRIVERHGGRIWFESLPGQGSTFYFTLPKEGLNQI